MNSDGPEVLQPLLQRFTDYIVATSIRFGLQPVVWEEHSLRLLDMHHAHERKVGPDLSWIPILLANRRQVQVSRLIHPAIFLAG